jgi:predicted amidohydrolase
MLIKVVAVQAEMGERLTLEEMIHIFKHRPDFVCLPEYYLIDSSVSDYHRAALRQLEFIEYLQRLSEELNTCIVGGTVVEAFEGRIYNSSFIIDHGVIVGRYRKRYPVPGELAKGISAGSENCVCEIDGVRIGMMICGDVFYPHLYDELRADQADVVFVPTTSLYRPDDSLSQKKHRDQKYFLSGAAQSAAYVVKVCGVGEIFGRPLQGRTLVAAPWGMITQTTMYEETQRRILTATLDIDEVREFRRRMSYQTASTTPRELPDSASFGRR